MNKLISVVMRERVSLFCYRHITRSQVLYSSTSAFPSSLFQRQNHQQNSFVKASLSFDRQISFLHKIKAKLYSFISDTNKSRAGGCLAFENIADNVDYIEFCQRFGMPDTFHSWFLSLQLHVWMTILTTITEKQGRVFRNSLVDSMWEDVQLRLDQLAQFRSSDRKACLKELVMQFRAALIAYDEGILSDDTVLAAAVWRMLFACRPVDPELLENVVLYIRKQLLYLDSQNTQEIVFHGSVTFLPLNSILSEEKDT